MFADIHSHIIPGLDDGSRNLDMTLKMLEAAAADGTGHIAATLHFNSAADQDYGGVAPEGASSMSVSDMVRERTVQLRELASEHHIEIEIYPGMEVLLQPDTPSLLEDRTIATINDTRYALVEFPIREIPLFAFEILYQMQLRGYIPILAHPERCMPIIRDNGILVELIDRGALVQVNAGSLTGLFGRKVRKTALRMIRRGMVHFVASDAHSNNGRTPELSKAAGLVRRKFGKAAAERLFYENGMTVLKDGLIEMT